MTTSTRLNPPLLELNLACAIDRHRLRLAVPRHRDGDRRADLLGRVRDDVPRGAVRAELDGAGADRGALRQDADGPVVVRPRHQVVVRRERIRRGQAPVRRAVRGRTEHFHRSEVAGRRAVELDAQDPVHRDGLEPRALELALDLTAGAVQLRALGHVREHRHRHRHQRGGHGNREHQLRQRKPALRNRPEMHDGRQLSNEVAKGSNSKKRQDLSSGLRG